MNKFLETKIKIEDAIIAGSLTVITTHFIIELIQQVVIFAAR